MKISTIENIDFNSISTIIFDWGGVITNIHPAATVDAFSKLGHHSLNKYLKTDQSDDLFLRFEMGKASEEEIYEQLRTDIGRYIQTEKLHDALCAMLLDTPEIRLNILEKLGKKFKLLLLSNTNPVHTRYYNNYLREQHSVDFHAFFQKVYYSYELGMRKPDPEIFKFVLADNKLDGHKTLFIDDTEINTQVARSLNIQSLYLNERMTLESIFL